MLLETFKKEKIFSIKNEYSNNKKYKVITVLGIKIKKRIKSELEKAEQRRYASDLTIKEKKLIIENQFEKSAGYKPDIENPKTFNEKLQWLKLYNEDPLLTKCSDKYLVREYVKEKITEEYLVPLLGVWDKPEDIDFDMLPDKFVLKVNWGSGQNIIVKDKSKLDIQEALQKLRKWMEPHSNHYYMGFEWCYKNIQPKIIAEEYIEQQNGPVYDYKFFCFNGNPQIMYIAVDSFDYSIMCINYYDINFNKLDLIKHYPNTENPLEKPVYWDNMIEISKKLSKDFPFARVDFFDTGKKLFVGEITFYPGNGMDKFEPAEWDYKLGEMLKLPVETSK